ncbi:big1 [Wolffia australiana]
MSKRRHETSETKPIHSWKMKTERAKSALPWPPPRKTQVTSVTRAEIESFWRRKKMEEEDHLLAALKAAARIRARNLKKEDYELFEKSLAGIISDREPEPGANSRTWWTKSKYAYLNQPPAAAGPPRRARLLGVS